ncbi:MAG: phosphoglycerate transporter protein PgtP [Coxiellaceae bacterium]|jgi:OPA family glycerol-3-phosphate transporter-like MFS transporter|nr:phosphoglycerate transporter protein PgtP [Coxiellaceae bacterium]
MKRVLKVFRPAPHIARLPQEKITAKYKLMRWQVFFGIFFGYVSLYFLRNNFSLAMPYMLQEGFSKTQLGLVFSALPLAYGISKFIMGAVSDRSNPRYFMTVGLIISALINLFYGTNFILSSISLMFILMFFNGWCQGMGWPASARVIVHWFSKKERGTKTALWGTAVNIGGGLVALLVNLGLMIFASWHSIFYFPAIISLVIAIFVWLTVRDTPQSEGLPPIEEHKKHHYENIITSTSKNYEEELSTKEILFKYVFVNKYLWYLALANMFVYIIRYGVINWIPTYLTQAKEFTPSASRWAYFLCEFAGIAGTVLGGWLSDQFFHTRRAPVGIIFMFIVTIGILAYWFVPRGYHLADCVTLIVVGCAIYGPILMIYVSAMDMVPKKAAGTAAGLVGLFGYVGGAVLANAGVGYIVDRLGWDGGFVLLLISCGLTILFFALTWEAKANASF